MIVVNKCTPAFSLKNPKDAATATNIVYLEVFADAISELTGGGEIEDLPEGTVIQPGSVAYDATGKVAVYSSTGWSEIQ